MCLVVPHLEMQFAAEIMSNHCGYSPKFSGGIGFVDELQTDEFFN